MLSFRLFPASSRAWPAAAAALMWALAAGSALLWWLHAPGQEAGVDAPVASAPLVAAPASTAFAARALGQIQPAEAAPDAQRRFVLRGVIASDSGRGSALLAVDGQPPQAFVQGQSVAEGWRLQSVSREGVRLSADGATLDLTLPARP